MPTTLAIADHREIVRLGLKSWLEGTSIELTGEAADEKQLWRLLKNQPPQVVMLDAQFSGRDGFQTLAKIKSKFPNVAVIVWGDGDYLTHVARAYAREASGYCRRNVQRRELLEVIRRAAEGESAWSAEDLGRFKGTPELPDGCDVHLSPRQREAMRYLGYGLSNREIARVMEIDYETVKEHVHTGFRRLGVNDRAKAVVWAIRNGLC